MTPLLTVNNLHVSFHSYQGEIQAVRGIHFAVKPGETLAIVGESGCGKSVTAQTIMRLLPSTAKIVQGEIRYEQQDLTQLTEVKMESIRGSQIAMIFQDPMTSLNPTMTIGQQLMEGLRKHLHLNKRLAKKRAEELLSLVGISNPHLRLKQYPHQLSGGMRQRVMIAIALAGDPKLLIADEPTTALDVTIQAQIMELLKSIQEKMGMALLLITHDLGIVAEVADRVMVMYAGKIVEHGTVDELFQHTKHPYTWGLLRSLPQLKQSREESLVAIPGSPPDLLHPPKACPYVNRCLQAMVICDQTPPELTACSSTHQVACWLEHPMASKEHENRAGGDE
ncbi:oligopeptide transport system ATP-binding protein [Seinonella peptonophila]|uniref:Oligopeptide transport system ATP-binding protein n=1 Tax=Seinonella peptonophila TaxID=112248 RepID=A0A1M4XIX1_9BACL|nr:ABC transporter ATP-binding protein [Seinonella peptonophila]SHE93112.1 oligopeptide transport system ATP-binding protein [Seinonella peptonophila]